MPHSLVAVLAAMFVGVTALADGKAFPRIADNSKASIPDQQALISYAEGVETLVIETRVEASGSELAWVVPTPTQPVVSAGTTGTFPTLRAIFTPSVSDFPLLGLVLGLSILSLVVALEFLIWRRKHRVGSPAVLFAILVLGGGFCLLPSLGKARGSASVSMPEVQVHERKIVGAYDVAVLSGDNAASLTTWLAENGFAVPKEDEPTIAAYVQEGWCFVASRLLRDETGDAVLTPHPLVLRFATTRPVYPMRLTAHGMDEALELELYVFGSGTASAPGMRVVATDPVLRSRVNAVRPSDDGYEVLHATLESLIAEATHVTQLRGVIPREDITGDLAIAFGPPESKHPWVVSHGTARLAAAAAGTSLALMTTLGFLVHFRGRAPRERLARTLLSVVAIALGGAAVTMGVMPSVDTKSGRGPWYAAARVRSGAQYALAFDRPDNPRATAEPKTLDEARQRVADWFHADDIEATEGDGPGQYRLELDGERINFIYTDEFGREIEDWAGSLAEKPSPETLEVLPDDMP